MNIWKTVYFHSSQLLFQLIFFFCWRMVFYQEDINQAALRCMFGTISDHISVGSCLNSGRGKRRSFVPVPKWCWWAASWTWGRTSAPWGSSPSSASYRSPTSRWEFSWWMCEEKKTNEKGTWMVSREKKERSWKQQKGFQKKEIRKRLSVHTHNYSILVLLFRRLPTRRDVKGDSCNTMNHSAISAVWIPSGRCWILDQN